MVDRPRIVLSRRGADPLARAARRAGPARPGADARVARAAAAAAAEGAEPMEENGYKVALVRGAVEASVAAL